MKTSEKLQTVVGVVGIADPDFELVVAAPPRASKKRLAVIGAALTATVAACAPATVEGAPAPLPPESRTATAPTTPSVVTPSVRGNTPSTPTARTAVYFQPPIAGLPKQSRILPEGLFAMVAEPGQPHSWTAKNGKCNPENADGFTVSAPYARTMVGYSVGRVGIPYALSQLNDEQESKIRYALIVAPGNEEDLLKDACDPKNSGALIGRWLKNNPAARFAIIGDARTAENNHAGIYKRYLQDPAIQGVHKQVTVCTSSATHDAAWNNNKIYTTGAPPIGAGIDCPPGTTQLEW